MGAEAADRFHRLLSSPDLLALERTLSRPNLFAIVGASHTEMWHSAFLSWILGSGSKIGLGDFPLKRFLYLCLAHGEVHPDSPPPPVTWVDFEETRFPSENVAFETEFTDDDLMNERGKPLRVDVCGSASAVLANNACASDGFREPIRLRLLIENKVRAREGNDQTLHYANFARRTGKGLATLLVFLTPDDTQEPASKEFITITYQKLFEYVLLPCSRHPQLQDEPRFLLEQYILNLGNPIDIRGGKRVMANINKEICARIYAAHREVLDEIFLSVNNSQPQGPTSPRTVRRFSVSLTEMFEQGILRPTDSLRATFREAQHTAKLWRTDDGSVVIVTAQGEFDSLSSAAQALTGQSVNGWRFWEVVDEKGMSRGRLWELREELDSSSTQAAG